MLYWWYWSRENNQRGRQFSWSNKRDAEDKIYSHIDWTFGNPNWFQIWAGIEVVYMLPEVSDHSHILLNTEVNRTKVRRPFRLLKVLLQQEEYRETVNVVWRKQIQGISMFRIWKRLKILEVQTKYIHKEYSSIDKKLEVLRKTLKTIQKALNDDYFNPVLIEEEKQTIKLIKNWDAVQERVLIQKSRSIWIVQGDSNFKYFHTYLKARQARNRVSSIYNE